jgi:UDPglucose--hexose-1-phosphate uridylyltransferase
MAELRWNPLLGTYTMVAANRQGRPNLPTDYCPFCPGSGKVPDDYEVYLYPNDFPALSTSPEEFTQQNQSDIYFKAPAYGQCEVILYSPDHYKGLAQLPQSHIYKLVKLWQQRYEELAKDLAVKYIFAFENRGEEVGVTIHHPHGQLYAYPFIPLNIGIQLDNCKRYFEENNIPLFRQMNAEEQQYGKRVVYENENFIAYLPYFTDYPFGIFIVTKNDRGNLGQMSEKELDDLAEILKMITGAFDELFSKPFPYMMCIQQNPVNESKYEGAEKYYHFHIEFYPPLRDKDRIKWMASSETGVGAAANTRYVEDTAQELREALQRFRNKLVG